MKKKVLMSIVLLALIGTSAVFAQKAGDTRQIDGQTWRVESNSNGKMVLQLVPSLDGNWFKTTGVEMEIAISGSTGINTYIKPNTGPAYALDGINKGFYKVGTQEFRNLRNTGNLKWSGQYFVYLYNTSTNVVTGTRYDNITITMSADGQTFTDSTGRVFTRGSYPR